MKYKLPTLILLAFIAAHAAFGQVYDGQFSENHPALTFQYFCLERHRLAGNTELKLNTDFGYIRLFDRSQRFAPDEPSSFSSLELTFLSKPVFKNGRWELSAGIFRNHIKGDFLLKNQAVHFGKGNSQVGFSSTGSVISPAWMRFSAGLTLQAGVGAHFTRLTSGQKKVEPGEWGIRGFGASSNLGLWLRSPLIFKRLRLNAGGVSNFTFARFQDFSVTNANTGDEQTFENTWFLTSSKPAFTISLSVKLGNGA
ncbi:MAG: hypothetical protein AAB316_06310 [Bacteroidota bacterium]